MRTPFHIATFFCIGGGLLTWFLTDHVFAGVLVSVFLFLGAIAYGAAFIGSQFFIRAFNRGSSASSRILLSFDDGPHPYTPEVLDVLRKHQVQALFFLIGKNAEKHPAIAAKIVSEGHTIGNHSHTHAKWFDFWSTGRMLEDINRCTKTIAAITDVTVCYFRPPYGVTNPPLARAVAASGLQTIGWNLRTMDTVKGAGTDVMQKVMRKVKNGSIILFHDTTPQLATLLDRLIPELKAKGFNFVTIEELKQKQ